MLPSKVGQRWPEDLALPWLPLGHPCRLAETSTSVNGLASELLFDAQKLVVFGSAFAAAWCAGLDLTSAESNSEIGNVVVFGLTRPVGGHDAPAILLGKLDGSDRLTDGTNLVHLEKEAVRGALLDSSRDLVDVCDGQVIAHDLDLFADLLAELAPVVPIVLVKGVLDGHNGVLVAHLGVKIRELVTREHEGGILVSTRSLEVQIVHVLVRDLELGGGDIQAHGALVRVSSLGNGLH
mmetsp:Transcript_6485/g.19015  ORF Transcript_6485/g.19015 Transcript_6485/m.19015 type:complete len:237 (-) Transcript_6485:775-1485(-)